MSTVDRHDAVAEELVEQGKDVLIVDRDESRVESLRDQDLDARTADIREPEAKRFTAREERSDDRADQGTLEGAGGAQSAPPCD